MTSQVIPGQDPAKTLAVPSDPVPTVQGINPPAAGAAPMIRLNIHQVIDDNLTTIGAAAARQDSTHTSAIYITICVSALLSAREQMRAVLNLLTDDEYDQLVTQGALGLRRAAA